jgi:hypothetical protein
MDWGEIRIVFNQKHRQMLAASERSLSIKEIREREVGQASRWKPSWAAVPSWFVNAWLSLNRARAKRPASSLRARLWPRDTCA